MREKNESVEHVLLAINASIRFCVWGAHKKSQFHKSLNPNAISASERGQCCVLGDVCVRENSWPQMPRYHYLRASISSRREAESAKKKKIVETLFFGQQFFLVSVGKNLNGSARGTKNSESNDDK